MLLGDFKTCYKINNIFLDLIDVTSIFGLQIISEPTRSSKSTATLIDMCQGAPHFAPVPPFPPPLATSEYNCIHLQMSPVSPCPRHPRREVWFYSKGDLESVNEVLLLNLPDTIPDIDRDAHSTWESFKSKFLSAISDHIKSK